VAEARLRDFAGLQRAAGDFGALDDDDLPALGGKMQSGGQPVDAGADHHGIVRHPLAPDTRRTGSLASADISYLKCLR
jgi:hypothetical protein